MSFFPNSSGVIIINGGEFVNNLNEGTNKPEIEKGIEHLRRSIAPGAVHDSDERYDPPKCHPHTREAVLQEIMDWIKDSNRRTRILWMYGAAGAGKSAIEQTIAESCYRMNLLAASFFFSRSVNGRNNKTFLITTIVDQLIVSIPEIREHVGIALYNNPSLLTRSLEAQMDALIVKPLEAAASRCGVDFMNLRPKVIVLDGLDECGDPESQRYILKVLTNSINKQSLPFSFILASRPEQHIRQAFDIKLLRSMTTRLVLDDKYLPDVDIRIFLQSEFQDIKNQHPSCAHLPSSWPSDKEVENLVQKSSGQFIFASTVIKFVNSHRHWPPDRLKIIFGISPPGKTTPFAAIDSIYFYVLMAAFDNIDSALEIFAVLLFLRHRNLKITPRFIEFFLSLREGEVFTILSDLHSIIAVPSANQQDLPLRFFHASLGDFLTDHSRSGNNFFLDSGICHRNIANRIIKQLTNQGRRNYENVAALQVVFPAQCLKATPDPEFLSNLYGLDMSLCPHLDFSTSTDSTPSITEVFKEIFDAINSTSRVPELFVWMKSQKHPDQSNNLFVYHEKSIKSWLREELFLIPNTEILQHLFAYATLVDFQQFRDVHHLIPQALDPPKHSYYPQIEDSNKWEIYVEYRKIVSRFLIDQNGAQIPHNSRYYSLFCWSRGRLVQEHYVSLAKYLLRFLKESPCVWEYEVDIPKAVLVFLPIVFSEVRGLAAARDLLKAGYFSLDPRLRSLFPHENWDQLSSSSYKACELALTAKGDNLRIPDPDAEIGTSSWGSALYTMLWRHIGA